MNNNRVPYADITVFARTIDGYRYDEEYKEVNLAELTGIDNPNTQQIIDATKKKISLYVIQKYRKELNQDMQVIARIYSNAEYDAMKNRPAFLASFFKDLIKNHEQRQSNYNQFVTEQTQKDDGDEFLSLIN